MIDADAERLAVFVQEYVKHEQRDDAGVLAVIAADLRDPQWLPDHVAELLLARPEIQAAIKAAKSFYKAPEIKKVSQDTIMADAEVIFQSAKADRQYTAALSAKKLQAELSGLLKKEIDVNIKHVITMSDAELERVARSGVIEGEFKELPVVHEEK